MFQPLIGAGRLSGSVTGAVAILNPVGERRAVGHLVLCGLAASRHDSLYMLARILMKTSDAL